jgi:hypothetical protein
MAHKIGLATERVVLTVTGVGVVIFQGGAMRVERLSGDDAATRVACLAERAGTAVWS